MEPATHAALVVMQPSLSSAYQALPFHAPFALPAPRHAPFAVPAPFQALPQID